MNDVAVNMGEVASTTAAELGAEIGRLTAELNAQRAVNRALFERLAEMENAGQSEDKKAKTG